MGWSVDPGQNSLMLKFKSGDAELNFGIFRTDGSFQNRGIGRVPQIGELYLKQLASVLPDARVQEAKDKFLKEVRKRDGSNLAIAEVLSVQDKWLEIIQGTINEFFDSSSGRKLNVEESVEIDLIMAPVYFRLHKRPAHP